MKVLITEDEPEVGRLLLVLLKKWNMNAVLARNGEEACQLLIEDPVDLLITDLVMPNMTGLELVRHVRQIKRYRHLPVLMISGKAQKTDIAEAAQLGVNGFIAKPFTPSDIRRKILAVYRNQKQALSQQRAKQVWNDRLDLMEQVSGPLIIFGESVRSGEELRHPNNRALVTYLSQAWEAIEQTNTAFPDVKLAYIIEDDTTALIMHLKKHATKQWVKLILLSTKCRGNPTLIVRLFTINRKDDLPIFLVYDHLDEIGSNHREALKKLGVHTLPRSKLDQERVQKLIDKYILDKTEPAIAAAAEEALSPREVHGRITADLETMTSLPPLPQVYEKISALSKDPHSDLKEWIKVIKVDPMTCATILRHTNSLSYGFKAQVTEIDRSVILLGKNVVAGLVASEAVRQTFSAMEEKGFILEDFWRHNVAVGFAAYILSFPLEQQNAKQAGHFAALGLTEENIELLRKINLPKRFKLDLSTENPFVGGMMHDIGKAAMAHSYPGLFPLVVAELKQNGWNAPMLAAEQAVAGGLTHTVVGDILMRNWGMGEELRRVVLHHHQPEVDDLFTLLIGMADVIGQALYPFPREAEYPLAKALEEEALSQVVYFLPAGFSEQPYLKVEEFTALAKAIAPRVKYLTEKMHLSLQ